MMIFAVWTTFGRMILAHLTTCFDPLENSENTECTELFTEFVRFGLQNRTKRTQKTQKNEQLAVGVSETPFPISLREIETACSSL
jgi:hypothetical protein